MPRMTRALAAAAWLVAGPLVAPALAQERPAPAVEISTGWAGFIDDAMPAHLAAGGGLRWHVTPRLSLGPEIVYMVGPGTDRDLFVTANLIYDLLGPGAGWRRATPYVVAGGGLFQHRIRFSGRGFTSSEGAFTGGGGVRLRLAGRVYVAPEFRVGWEPHMRAGVTLGIALGG